jgi:hypothetical protein
MPEAVYRSDSSCGSSWGNVGIGDRYTSERRGPLRHGNWVPPVERPDDVSTLAMEFRGAVGAIVESGRVEDVIRSSPHDV